MTIEELSHNVIEKLKSLPDQATQEGKKSDFNSLWDEYKEQLQYQLYPNYDIFEEDVQSLAYEEIQDLSDSMIKLIYRSVQSSYNPHKYMPKWELTPDCYSPPASFEEKREHIVDTILLQIQTIASSEEIECK